MDEWFVNLQIVDYRLEGTFRVPSDQADKLAGSPIAFSVDGEPLSVAWTESGRDEDGRRQMSVSGRLDPQAETLSVRVPPGLLDQNQSLVGFLQAGTAEPTTIFIAPGSEGEFSLLGQPSVELSVSEFFKLGVTHILEGYDHLLFLFCLLIAGGTVRHFLVVVTAFTLGHSVTLAASVLGYVSLPPSLTETIIALSIVVAGLMNIPLLNKKEVESPTATIASRGLMAGGFGLIHGLGFAGILKEIGVEGGGALAPLVGFNLGVEAGQIVLVLLFYPLLFGLHRWRRGPAVLKGCSYGAAAVGVYWVLERTGLV